MTGPSLRDRLKPLELVGMAGVLALFTGVIAIGGTREWQLALIFAGIAFIAALLVLAMLALAAGAPEEGTGEGGVIDRPVLEPREPEAPPAPEPGDDPGPDRG
jgi:hypothetical protein